MPRWRRSRRSSGKSFGATTAIMAAGATGAASGTFCTVLSARGGIGYDAARNAASLRRRCDGYCSGIRCRLRESSRVAQRIPCLEEPDAGIPHVRIRGSPGKATTRGDPTFVFRLRVEKSRSRPKARMAIEKGRFERRFLRTRDPDGGNEEGDDGSEREQVRRRSR